MLIGSGTMTTSRSISWKPVSCWPSRSPAANGSGSRAGRWPRPTAWAFLQLVDFVAPLLDVGVVQAGDDGFDDFEIVRTAGDDDAVGARIDGDAQVDERRHFRRVAAQRQQRPGNARGAGEDARGDRRRAQSANSAAAAQSAAAAATQAAQAAAAIRRRPGRLRCPGRGAAAARRCCRRRPASSVKILTSARAAGATSSSLIRASSSSMVLAGAEMIRLLVRKSEVMWTSSSRPDSKTPLVARVPTKRSEVLLVAGPWSPVKPVRPGVADAAGRGAGGLAKDRDAAGQRAALDAAEPAQAADAAGRGRGRSAPAEPCEIACISRLASSSETAFRSGTMRRSLTALETVLSMRSMRRGSPPGRPAPPARRRCWCFRRR